jgi:GNAT superfamily N-acetyltransferase
MEGKVNVRIRKAREADLEQVLDVYREAGLAVRGSLSPQTARGVFERMSSYPNYTVYVAELDGRICGTFALLIMDNLANGGMPSGVVEDVAVSSAFQGQGIGKAMMRFAMDECRRNRCYKMTLSSNAMRTEAHRFYESLGFVRHGYSYRVEL